MTRPPTIASFTASPSTIGSGLASTLSWSVTGASTISINQGVGTVSGSSTSVRPVATTTYTLTATNSYGRTRAYATVTVTSGSFTVGGAVTGLASGASMVLRNNGASDLTVNANGPFTFNTPLASGSAYAVTVFTQPMGQTCAVTGGSGTVGSANVTTVAIACTSNTYTVGGTVTGLTGSGLVLATAGEPNLSVAAGASSFTFATPLASGSAYAVTVATQPSGQTCSIASGSGVIASASVTGVAVTCSATTYTVGGTIAGLATGASVVLRNNGAGNLTVNANGPFTFSTPLASGSAYAVTVFTQPIGQTCAVTGGSGTVGSANVTTVAIACTSNTYTVGGTVTGLTGSGLVLATAGEPNLSVAAGASSFTFATPLASGTAYAVTVASQPSGQTCSVVNGTGAIAGASVTSVAVTCSATTYTVGGTIAGLATGASVVLRNNGAGNLTVNANGPFTFSTPLASGSAYAVTVFTQPIGQTCAVTSGTGTVGSASVTTVAIACAMNTFLLGGTVTGLTGSGLVLATAGEPNLSVAAGASSFTFATPLASGTAYAVTVATQPSGQTCSIASGSGAIASANVTGVAVTCSNASGVAAQMAVLAQRAIFFEHTVVGSNIEDGLDVLRGQVTGARPTIRFATDGTAGASAIASALGPGVFYGNWFPSQNSLPLSKMTTFESLLNGGVGSRADVAMMKFTFPDLPSSDDTITAATIFTAYRAMVSRLQAAYPRVKFVHWTMPLNMDGPGSNGPREAYNNLLRGAYVGKEPLFDLALVESTRPDGTREMDGGIPSMYPGYTPAGDGGQLNAAGADRVARALLDLLANLPGASTPAPTFTVGGTVAGLATGTSVALRNNGGNDLTVGANGGFTFSTPLATGSGYAVTVLTQPVGQACTVSGGSGTISSANVTGVVIACAVAPSVVVSPSTASLVVNGTFQFGATVTGLADPTVSWTVQEGTSGGRVGATGLYTAPAASGTYHVVAASVADPARSGTATVTVSAGSSATSMPLVSRGLPAFASSGVAAAANDADYGTEWTGSGASWLAYDLAGAGPLGTSLVAWYNDDTYGYDQTYNAYSDGIPGDYVIEVHADSGSASPPTSGWVTAVSVPVNPYANRWHTIDLSGQRWLRFRGSPSPKNGTAQIKLNLDVFDARGGFTDAWAFVGDSNTALYMTHAPMGGQNFSERVHASRPASFPAYLNCGVPGLHAIDEGLPVVQQVLADHPQARYVAITLGGNDSNSGLPGTYAFYDAYRSMVDAVLSAGRIPVVPRTVIWHGQPVAHAAISDPSPYSLDNQLARLISDYAGRIKVGPDLWTPLDSLPQNSQGQPVDASGHPLVETDLTHASNPWGIVFARNLWSDAMLGAVY